MSKSKLFTFLIGNRPFKNILNQKKDLEGRLYKGKYKRVSVGDVVYFKNNQDLNETLAIEAKICKIFVFPNFNDAFENLNPERAISGLSKAEVIAEYHKYYSEKEIIKYGVVFFEFMVQ